jgi:acyl-CoA thioester hydrolase
MNEHTTLVRVRYGETDQMGVVYHPNYFLYFEAGRTELLRASGVVYSELERTGVYLVVTEARCRYRAAARYDQELRIVTRVESVTKVTVRFSYRVLGPDGVLLAVGETELASVDRAKSPIRLPAGLANLLQKS